MIRSRHGRIVATLGPSSRAPETVLALARAGVDVFRLNFSHGPPAEHAAAFEAVRNAEVQTGRPLGVMADLQGPKFRLGAFIGGRTAMTPGQGFRLDLDPTQGDDHRVGLPHPELLAAMTSGSILRIDDGKVRLRVERVFDGAVDTVVERGRELSDRKGVTLRHTIIPVSALTGKDRADLSFALDLGVDWVALSFVQRAADMAELRALVNGKAAVLAKIETPAALADVEAILDLCDGIMVARGDLGMELEPEDVPVAQKQIVRAARRKGVPVIIATQMLDSMTHNEEPTRAEASDVANAVYEGVDAVMLSGETAVGEYPVEAVATMDRIMVRVERDERWPELMRAEHTLSESDADVLIAAARRAADATSTACLVAFTCRGGTARGLARERPLQPSLVLTPSLSLARRLALTWGLEVRVASTPIDVEGLTSAAVNAAVSLKMAPPGARIAILAGTPFGSPGATNILRFAHAP